MNNSNYQKKPTPIPQQQQPPRVIPISLGKPSLRQRLEAYYSLISPDIVSNHDEWKQKFDIIYEKYGGSVEGEARLARKLVQKYGKTVRLRLTTPGGGAINTTSSNSSAGRSNTNNNDSNHDQNNDSNTIQHDEKWYELTSKESNSHVVDFTSNRFDPVSTLIHTDPSIVYNENTFIKNSPLLDNLAKFVPMLPRCDPLWKDYTFKNSNIIKNDTQQQYGLVTRTIRSEFSGQSSTTTTSISKKIQQEEQNANKKPPPPLTALANQFENAGPLSLLHSIYSKRQRVKVMIRYVDCIRGTLTGYLIAFDKHFNMILRDVDEEYVPRGVVHKRHIKMNDDSINIYKKRHFQQILVRGDNVVLIWKVDKKVK